MWFWVCGLRGWRGSKNYVWRLDRLNLKLDIGPNFGIGLKFDIGLKIGTILGFRMCIYEFELFFRF